MMLFSPKYITLRPRLHISTYSNKELFFPYTMLQLSTIQLELIFINSN